MGEVIKRRRTQAERSTQTRTRVIEAAIHCLHKRGFSATTTLLVAEVAKVSRGALLHHFPTRTDLLLCVVKTVFENEVVQVMKFVEESKRTSDEMLQNMWDTLNGSEGTAVREILQGARSDRILLKKLSRLQNQLEQRSIDLSPKIDELDEASGNPFRTLAGIRLVHWCMRGLSNAKTLYENPDDVQDLWTLFKVMLLSFQKQEIARHTGALAAGLSRQLAPRQRETV